LTILQSENLEGAPSKDLSAVTGADRRTLDAIFRHPLAHNLGWNDVVALLEKIGEVEEKANSEFSLRVGGKHHLMHKPRTKGLTAPELIGLRQFLLQAGWSPEQPPQAVVPSGPTTPSLMVVVDHHGARIFDIDVASDDASKHVIKPYDPHHFLHHLTHKDQSRERGQRAPEEPSYYEQIAQAVVAAGSIVVVGHGAGHSNAAHHLIEYLRAHHRETYQRVVREVVADLSSITPPQLLDLARQALR
jgi:hypothetical protein